MKLTQEILKLNEQRSREFSSPAARDARTLYSSQHPTNILVFKCMDGRINLPLITDIPMGILHPFRNIGGKFVLGNPYLGRLVLDSKNEALRLGRPTLALCTYHFSRGSKHRGCAGHKYNTNAAKQGAFALKHEFEQVFGKNNSVIAAVVVGIETDEDALTFHNGDGTKLEIAQCTAMSDDMIRAKLASLYHDLPRRMLDDLLPLALGNRDHVAVIKREGRPVAELVHGENIIAVGRGFDWLHLPNRALIIGPYGHTENNWREAVGVAGSIVLDNVKSNRIPKKDGTLLLISAPYSTMDEYGLAIAKANYFTAVAESALQPVAKKLQLRRLIGITDMETLRFRPLSTL